MKTIDLLVQELPALGGWPDGAVEAGFLCSDDTLFFVNKDGNCPSGWRINMNHEVEDSWIEVTREQYEAALAEKEHPLPWDEKNKPCPTLGAECIGRDAAPVWNGECLPPVGCECEVSVDGGRSWCTYRAINEKNGARLIEIGNFTEEFQNNNCIFRPIRSESDRRRDAAKNAIAELCRSSSSNGHSADLIYDAIAAGEIPGVKLED